MTIMTTNQLPAFEEDLKAVKVQKAFFAENMWEGKAITAFRGRGVYEGMISYQDNGDKVHSHFSFILKEDSLKAFLKQVEHFMRHPEPEHEVPSDVNVSLDRLDSDLNYAHIRQAYSEDETTPVLYLNREGIDADRPVRNIMEYMYDQGTEIRWLATVVFRDGAVAGLALSDDQEKNDAGEYKNEEKIRQNLSELSEKTLKPCFASLMEENGHKTPDGIVFCTAAPGYDERGTHYNGAIKAIYDDADNIVIIQTPVLSEKKKREFGVLEEKRAILERFRASHPLPVKKPEVPKENVPAKKKKDDPEADARAEEAARAEAEKIRGWLKPGSPEEWKKIALDQYNGVGDYGGVIQYESTRLRFDLIQRHNDFNGFLALIAKLSIVDENGKHSVGNGEAKLKELVYCGGYYEIWETEVDEMEGQKPEDLDDCVRKLLADIRNGNCDPSDTLIRVSLRDGFIVHVNMNDKDSFNAEAGITSTLTELVPELEECLHDKLEFNGQEHASSLIVLIQSGMEDQNMVIYDGENNAIILKCEFAEKEKTK